MFSVFHLRGNQHSVKSGNSARYSGDFHEYGRKPNANNPGNQRQVSKRYVLRITVHQIPESLCVQIWGRASSWRGGQQAHHRDWRSLFDVLIDNNRSQSGFRIRTLMY